MGVVIVILSFIITFKICSVINRNTIGTTTGYLGRAIFVWAVVIAALSIIANKIGLI